MPHALLKGQALLAIRAGDELIDDECPKDRRRMVSRGTGREIHDHDLLFADNVIGIERTFAATENRPQKRMLDDRGELVDDS